MALFLPDANVLIHALHRGSPSHADCRKWLLDLTVRGDEIGLCELAEVAFLRIGTHPNIVAAPMDDVIGFWKEDLWRYPGTRRLSATPEHPAVFGAYVTELGLVGNDINDAWMAALAVTHGATLVSQDRGFARFRGLRWMNPA
jgi:toxin-antitoxin system PIN domain toxin